MSDTQPAPQPPSAGAGDDARPFSQAGYTRAMGDTLLSRGAGTMGFKLLAIGALVLALLVPQFFVAQLIAEREHRQRDVRAEIGRAWGRPQTVLGPMLVVPVRDVAGPASGAAEPRSIVIPAAELTMTAALVPETRRRGLFEAVVYTARIEASGRFGDVAGALPPDVEADWAGAYLLTGASDLRPATEAPALRWGERSLSIMGEGGRSCGAVRDVMRWPLGLDGPPVPGTAFAGTMELRGTDTLSLLPAAARARLAATGAWASPSYVGADLPLRAVAEDDGFRAEWVGGMAAQAIRVGSGQCAVSALPAGMGVALLEAVPTYRMVNRTAKYATLFVLLALMTYWLFETTARIRIHLVQYAMLGLSMVLFPLLLLAIAEPSGFAWAYAVSTAMVMGQASLYTAAVTGRRLLAAIFAGVLAALFGFLYVVLRSESVALLAGALGLFAALSAVMVATRRIGPKPA